MKELSNYIYEKLDINKVSLDDRFPINGTLDDIIEFLEEQGYFGFSWLSETPGGWSKAFNYYKRKSFFSKPEDRWGYAYLKFADTTNKNIGKENPMYEIRFEGNNKIFGTMYGRRSIPVSKEEFLQRLNKQFKWE